MQTDTTNQYPDDEIDLRQLIATLWDGKWMIAATTFVSSAIAIAYALLATPIYRAEALVQIRQESRTGGGLNALAAQFGGLADFSGLTGGSGGDRALTLATLKSRAVVQSFIQDNNLLPELFEKAWDRENKRWKVNDPKEEPTLWHGYEAFSKGILKVTEERKTGLVTVAIEWRDPDVAAAWAKELIARTNVYLRDKTILESENNLDYLRQQVRQTGVVELQQAVYTLVESELKKLMLAKGGEEYAIRTIDPAQAPKLRIKPKRRQIAILGLLVGGFLGVVAVFLRNAFRPQTKTSALRQQ